MEWPPISEIVVFLVDISGRESWFGLLLARKILQLMRKPKARATTMATTIPAMTPGAKDEEVLDTPGLAGAGLVAGAPD